MPKKVLPMFPRPLFNAGRWSHRFSKFPEGAIVESDGLGRAREVLPVGYTPFVRTNPNRSETASSVPPSPNSGYRFGTSSHGGGCCGRRHVQGFRAVTKSAIAALKQNMSRMGTEVTLTTRQAKARGWEGYTWHEVLIELGWKLVFIFQNPNSGNNVRVYFHSVNEKELPR